MQRQVHNPLSLAWRFRTKEGRTSDELAKPPPARHVVTRRSLAERLTSGEDPATVLPGAVACVVTVEEHNQLTPFDLTHDGWQRYKEAGIEVLDMAAMERYL